MKKVSCVMLAMVLILLSANVSYGISPLAGPTDRRIVTQKEEDAHSQVVPKIYTPMILNWDDPGVGATKVVSYSMPGLGMIRQDQRSGIYSLIKDVSLIVVGLKLTTVQNIIMSVVQAVGASISIDRLVTAQTFISYRYVGKEGQVWTESLVWQTWFDTRSREVYKHYWGTYVCHNNFQRQATVDFLPPLHSWIRFDASPSYHNDSLIAHRAFDNWFHKRAWTVEYGY